MNATELVQAIKDANVVNTAFFFEVKNEEHDINIWFNRSFGKWVLELNGKCIKSSKSLELLVNKLVDLKLI